MSKYLGHELGKEQRKLYLYYIITKICLAIPEPSLFHLLIFSHHTHTIATKDIEDMSSKKGESNKRARADEDGDGKARF